MRRLFGFASRRQSEVGVPALLSGISLLTLVALLVAMVSYGYSHSSAKIEAESALNGQAKDALLMLPQAYADLGLHTIVNEKSDTYRLYLFGFKTRHCVIQFSPIAEGAIGASYIYEDEYVKQEFGWRPTDRVEFPYVLDRYALSEFYEILRRDKVYGLGKFDVRGPAVTDGQFVVFEAVVGGKYFSAMGHREIGVLAGVANLLIPKIGVSGCGYS